MTRTPEVPVAPGDAVEGDRPAHAVPPPDDEPLGLPEVFEGALDASQVAALFDALRHHVGAASVEVQVRQRALVAVAPRPTGDEPTAPAEALDAAQAAVLGTPPRAVQLRYRWDGVPWCDTLLPGPGAVRVVRVRQDLTG